MAFATKSAMVVRLLKSSSYLGLGLAAALAVSACSKDPESARVSGDVRVRLPWANEKGEMKLDVVSLGSVDNLNQVRGQYAEFIFAPKILEDRLAGDQPRARFLQTADGIFVPTDKVSQEMAMIYAHLERLASLDSQAGVGGLLTWPRRVGVSVRIRNDDALMADNSFYDSGSDSILMVPTKNGQLPLAANPGVLAHEHFHALFYRLVQMPLVSEGKLSKTIGASAHAENELKSYFLQQAGEKIAEKPGGEEPRLRPQKSDEKDDMLLYHSVLMKAVNEGLADVWGWIYSGNPDFLGSSLPSQKECRSLRADHGCKTRKDLYDNRDKMKDQISRIRSDAVNPGVVLNNYAYLPGTQLSRAIRNTFLTDKDERSAKGLEERRNLAARIIAALPRIALQIQSDVAGKETDIEGIFKIIMETQPMNELEKTNATAWIEKKDAEAAP